MRSAVPAPEKAAEPAPSRPAVTPLPPGALREAVDKIAVEHGLPAPLVHSVIKVESNYDPLAVSPKGAQGLMQLVPATARRFGVSDVFNPLENIQGGARYLRYLLNLYNDDYDLALAAYNAGEQAVARYGGVPPYAETRNYLVQVQRRAEEIRTSAPPAASAAAARHAAVEAPPAEVHNRIEEVMDADGKVYYITRQD